MRWRDGPAPVQMQRVALLAPREALRDLLVGVADDGTVAFDADDPGGRAPDPAGAQDGSAGAAYPASPATNLLARLPAAHPAAALAPAAPDLDRCQRDGRLDLIAGEAELERRRSQALTAGSVCALAGWMPAAEVARLAARLAPAGGAVVPLRRPPGAQPPTLLAARGAAGEFAPLVQTYATVPYADLNPALVAGLAYVVMFGMMFADVGHGALLLAAALAIRAQHLPRLARLRRFWLFLAGAGLSSMVFGALYGEFFGPTRVLPVVWLAPLDHPVTVLAAAVAAGAVLLTGAYALGTVNRFREGGWRQALYAPSGLAGVALFLGLAVLGAGVYAGLGWVVILGAAVTAGGLTGCYLGLFAAAGGGVGGGAQAAVELFDVVVQIGSNLVSFARLAAFGMTHAALGAVIWQATAGAWRHGPLGVAAAVAVFVAGNVLTFTLEGLIAGIQALRLEYYELFSRVFVGEGRPFRPWHVPLAAGAGPVEVAT